MTVSGRLTLLLELNQIGAVDLGAIQAPFSYPFQVDLADGSGLNQVNKVFKDTRTIAASGSEDLDLAGGLNDAFGAALTFTKIRLLLVKASSANTNLVHVGGAGSNGFITPYGDATDLIRVRPGGAVLLFAPDVTAYAVTASTGDLLTIANSSSGTSVTYDIVLAGS